MNDRREIKFRAWDMAGMLFLDWSCINQTAFNRGDRQLLYHVFHSPKIILQQFTEHKDKTGKEIYEGDIIQCHPNDSLYVVEFANKSVWAGVGLKIIDSEGNKLWLHAFDFEESIIIGNICENPDIVSTRRANATREVSQ